MVDAPGLPARPPRVTASAVVDAVLRRMGGAPLVTEAAAHAVVASVLTRLGRPAVVWDLMAGEAERHAVSRALAQAVRR